MNTALYNISWVGIDAGREGLWQEPIWTRVIQLIKQHEGEKVYDPNSPIYKRLIEEFPNERWCSLTPEKNFRPLFRDYPNSWTRTGVICLRDKEFKLTPLGQKLLNGKETKQSILIDLFSKHFEFNPILKEFEAPFSILAHALLETPRPLTAKEIYWVVMKNYRPFRQKFKEVLLVQAENTPTDPKPTPYRRTRHMLQLLRAAGAIVSYRRGHYISWSPCDSSVLDIIIKRSSIPSQQYRREING